MGKRGQVSIFIILAIIIIGLIIVFFVFYNNGKIPFVEQKVNPEAQPVYNLVKSCLEITGEDAIEYIGFTGGYYTIPNESIEEGIAYYYDNGVNRMPTKEKIESEMSSYIEDLTFICIKEFSDFPSFEINEGEISVKSLIEKDKVVFDVNYPISIRKGENVYEIENFKNIEVPVRLLDIYDVSFMLIDDHIKNNGAICLSCMSEWSEDYELYFAMDDYDSETVIFSISDRNSTINDQDYTFNFANRY